MANGGSRSLVAIDGELNTYKATIGDKTVSKVGITQSKSTVSCKDSGIPSWALVCVLLWRILTLGRNSQDAPKEAG